MMLSSSFSSLKRTSSQAAAAAFHTSLCACGSGRSGHRQMAPRAAAKKSGSSSSGNNSLATMSSRQRVADDPFSMLFEDDWMTDDTSSADVENVTMMIINGQVASVRTTSSRQQQQQQPQQQQQQPKKLAKKQQQQFEDDCDAVLDSIFGSAFDAFGASSAQQQRVRSHASDPFSQLLQDHSVFTGNHVESIGPMHFDEQPEHQAKQQDGFELLAEKQVMAMMACDVNFKRLYGSDGIVLGGDKSCHFLQGVGAASALPGCTAVMEQCFSFTSKQYGAHRNGVCTFQVAVLQQQPEHMANESQKRKRQRNMREQQPALEYHITNIVVQNGWNGERWRVTIDRDAAQQATQDCSSRHTEEERAEVECFEADVIEVVESGQQRCHGRLLLASTSGSSKHE